MLQSRQYRCKPRNAGCHLRFCLYAFFMYPEALEEYPHYRQHGMCSKCKEKNDRRLARRKERLEGMASLNQAIRNDDEQGIDAYGHWCEVDSSYDELSERDPDEHEIMEMVNSHNELLEREFHDEVSEGDFDDELDVMEIDYFHDEMSDA